MRSECGRLKWRELASQISGLGTEVAFYKWCEGRVLLIVFHYGAGSFSVWKMVSSEHFLQKEAAKVYL